MGISLKEMPMDEDRQTDKALISNARAKTGPRVVSVTDFIQAFMIGQINEGRLEGMGGDCTPPS